MSTTITGFAAHTPLLVIGYKSARASRNIVHELANSNNPAITLRAAALRSGTMQTLWADATTALAFEAEAAAAQSLAFATTEIAGLNMTFVVTGEIAVELDPETRTLWVVAFEYQEIT